MNGPPAGAFLGRILAFDIAPPCQGKTALDERTRYLSALELARQLAPIFDLTEADAFDALCTVPDNMLELLRSPEGWTALASFIAADFGLATNTYQPTRH